MRSLFWICIGFCSLFITYTFISLQIVSFNFDYLREVAPNAVDEEALFSNCVLAEFDRDGWTKVVLEGAQVDYDPVKKCDEKFVPFTVLGDNGTVWLNKARKGVEEVFCMARALYDQGDWKFNTSEWFIVNGIASPVVFGSDFVHTTCMRLDNITEVAEDFIHLQMWNVKDDRGGKINRSSLFDEAVPIDSHSLKSVKEEEGEELVDEKPSVFIFVFDSVANSQALRSLPKTISLLEHEFDAVNLRHVNKAGENSHPNGIAFLIGKMITDMDRGIFGMGKERADWNASHACYRYFDDEPFILKQFTKAGYKSLMAEDWALGVFNYPNCWGFEKSPTTHYMRPFQMYYEQNMKQCRKFMGEQQCFEFHTFLFNYLAKFIKAYRESPKIAMVWASEIAHNYNDGLFHVDAQLFTYFKEHRAVLDKSYVFLMGDHGIRWGKVKNTWIGEREINNPMMFVSVPRHLRNRINPVLRENSGKLLTSFDIHASFVDILNEPHLGGKFDAPGLRGTSFFRALPSGERSCRTLPIPVQFCLCEWNKTKSENASVNDEIGRGAAALLNAKLKDVQIASTCEDYTFKKAIEVKKIDGSNGLTEIVFGTNECGAKFKTIVRVLLTNDGHLNVSLAASDFTRWNSYGDTAACMNSRAELRPLCCCRDRPWTTSTTTAAALSTTYTSSSTATTTKISTTTSTTTSTSTSQSTSSSVTASASPSRSTLTATSTSTSTSSLLTLTSTTPITTTTQPVTITSSSSKSPKSTSTTTSKKSLL